MCQSFLLAFCVFFSFPTLTSLVVCFCFGTRSVFPFFSGQEYQYVGTHMPDGEFLLKQSPGD